MSAAEASQAHPLSGNRNWKATKPLLGFETTYLLEGAGNAEPRSISAVSTCRESVIYDVRQMLRSRLTNRLDVSHLPWRERRQALAQGYQIDLKDSQPAELKIAWADHHMETFPEGKQAFPVNKFLGVCNTILGPVCVLLGPYRQAGDWWKTDPDEARRNVTVGGVNRTFIYWRGSDNWFLAHPATVSIALGLYRQCFHLCRAGVADEIIALAKDSEIEEALSTGSQKLALRVVKKTRPFIEVPASSDGYRAHYPFAKGLWRRLIRLQRAIRRDGYEGALDQTFAEGWGLLDGSSCHYSGSYQFWGDDGELTDKHRHLMKAGEPRRRKVADKPAAEASR